MAAAADEDIHRVAVRTVEFRPSVLGRRVGVGGPVLRRGQQQTPLRADKARSPADGRVQGRVPHSI